MDNKIKTFVRLADLFNQNGYQLYLVGGSTRDYLLNIPLTDMDVVTDATPEQEKMFLPNLDDTFAKFGSTKLVFEGVKFDITTLRKESEYIDSRHPSKIEFTNKLEEDVSRRDITINALYLSKDLKVIDLVNGVKDLNDGIIRMIGNTSKRIAEDPLRIVRILRFKLDLDFKLDAEVELAIKENISLLEKLNIDKMNAELNKCAHKEKLKELIKDYTNNS